MNHRLVLTAAALVLVCASVAGAQGQKAKTLTVTGPVAKVSGDIVSVDAGKGGPMQFVTTEATQVKVAGGGAKAQAARQAGQKGLKISDAVHEGDQVTVKYTDTGGKLVASEIDVRQRRPASAQKVK